MSNFVFYWSVIERPSVLGTRETRQGIRFCGDGGLRRGRRAKQRGKARSGWRVTFCFNALVPNNPRPKKKAIRRKEEEKTCGSLCLKGRPGPAGPGWHRASCQVCVHGSLRRLARQVICFPIAYATHTLFLRASSQASSQRPS